MGRLILRSFMEVTLEKLWTILWGLTSIGSHIGRSKMTTRADMEFIITSIYMLLKSILEAIKHE